MDKLCLQKGHTEKEPRKKLKSNFNMEQKPIEFCVSPLHYLRHHNHLSIFERVI